MVCALVCVALGLHGRGIDVVAAPPTTTAVTARQARRIATRSFGGIAPSASGWKRVGRVSVYLARVVQSNSPGPLGLFPDQLVWLVVIRDVTIPDLGLGPPGRPHRAFIGWVGVFVRTDTPRFIVDASF